MDKEEYKKYIEDNKHKIKNPERWVGYVPHRIENSDNPTMQYFSQNILFGRRTARDGKLVLATALYEPEYSSFNLVVDDKHNYASMDYFNQYDRRAKIVMKCYFVGNSARRYEAIKYFEDKWSGLAEGENNWDKFFIQVSFLNFVNGEKVVYDDL